MEFNYNAKKVSSDSSDGQRQFGSFGSAPNPGRDPGVNIDAPVVHPGLLGGQVIDNAMPPLPQSPVPESNILDKLATKFNQMSTYPNAPFYNINPNYRGQHPQQSQQMHPGYSNPQQGCSGAYQGHSVVGARPPLNHNLRLSYNASSPLHSPSASVIQGVNLPAPSKCYQPRELVNNPGTQQLPNVTQDYHNQLTRGMYSTPFYPSFHGTADPYAQAYPQHFQGSYSQAQALCSSPSYGGTMTTPGTPSPQGLPHFVDLRQRALGLGFTPQYNYPVYQDQEQLMSPPPPPVTVPPAAPKPLRKPRARKKVAVLGGDQVEGAPPPDGVKLPPKPRPRSTTPKAARPRSTTPRGRGRGKGRPKKETLPLPPEPGEDEGVAVAQFTPVSTGLNSGSVPTIPIGTDGVVNVNLPNLGTLNISDACFSAPPQSVVELVEAVAKTTRRKKSGESKPRSRTPKGEAKPRTKKTPVVVPVDGEPAPVPESKPRRKYVRKPKEDKPPLSPGALAAVQDKLKSVALAVTGAAAATEVTLTAPPGDTPEPQVKTEASSETPPMPPVDAPVKKPRSRKPKKTETATAPPVPGEVTPKTEPDTEVKTESPDDSLIDAGDERAQACLSQEVVPIVLLDDISMKKGRRGSENSRTRKPHRKGWVTETESESDDKSVAQRLAPRGPSRKNRPPPRNRERTSSPSSDDIVVRRTTRSSTAKLRATIPAKISMADYDSTDSEDDPKKRSPERPMGVATDVPVEIVMKEEVPEDDDVKPVVPPAPKRIAKLRVGNKRRPGFSARRGVGRNPRPKVEQAELQRPRAKPSLSLKTRLEYTSDELKRLYADGCFVISLAEAEQEPDSILVYQINKRENCLRQFYPAKFENFKYFVSSPVRWYFKDGDMTEEKLFKKFQAIPVRVLSEENKTDGDVNKKYLVETKIQFPYNGKSFYIRMTKALGQIHKTEDMRPMFKHLHITLAWKCMHKNLLAEIRKPDEEQNKLLQALKPVMQPFLKFSEKIQTTLTAAVAKANLPEEILYWLRSFHQMKFSYQKVEKGAACDVCTKVKVGSSRVLFVAEGSGWGDPYDLETLDALDKENWPKLPEKSIHFCRSCSPKALKLHRLIHWMYVCMRVIFVNMQRQLEHLKSQPRITKNYDKLLLWSESMKPYWRNNMFLDFQVCIAEVEIEFEL